MHLFQLEEDFFDLDSVKLFSFLSTIFLWTIESTLLRARKILSDGVVLNISFFLNLFSFLMKTTVHEYFLNYFY